MKEYKIDNPPITEVDPITDKCFRDCHNNYSQSFIYECIYDIKLTNITNNEIFNLTISGKSMKLYELNKKLTAARQNGFMFNQKNNLTKKLYSHVRFININYYLKSQIPMCYRQFLE